MTPVVAAAAVIGECRPILRGQSRLTVKRIPTLELRGSLDPITCQVLGRPQRSAYRRRMQNSKLLVAEHLRSLSELRLQNGWRDSACNVLRAALGLCGSRSLAEPDDRHEAEP